MPRRGRAQTDPVMESMHLAHRRALQTAPPPLRLGRATCNGGYALKDHKSARARFRQMHSEFFILPNAWSVGEVRQLEKAGFGAIATTSAGLSASMGREDLSLTRDETLANIRTLCAATELPINADFEAGFADDAGDVGANVSLAVEAGICALSIEDRK